MTSDSKVKKSRDKIYKDLMEIICGDNDAIFFPSPRMVLDKLEQQPKNELVSVANALVWLATGRKIPETGDPTISGVNADISNWCSDVSKRLEASGGQKLSNPIPLPDLWRESAVFAFIGTDKLFELPAQQQGVFWSGIESFERVKKFFNDQCIMQNISIWGFCCKSSTYRKIPSEWFFFSRPGEFNILKNSVSCNADLLPDGIDIDEIEQNCWSDIYVPSSDLTKLIEKPMYADDVPTKVGNTQKNRDDFESWVESQINSRVQTH